jgi:hypothetical protein
MKWLERLKNLESPDTYPREPREPGFLGLQGYPLGGVQKFEGTPAPAANYTDKVVEAGTLDPDRCCWPHSSAMNTAEIDRFLRREAQFTNKGLAGDDAERLADRLVFRDRDGDDRRVCLECSHLQGLGLWRCGNSDRAGVGRDLPRELAVTLQRCPGFTASGGRQ